MRILVYWEQESWGGVDSHLLTLLSRWPEVGDEFLVLVNKGNRGAERIRDGLSSLDNVRMKSIHSVSYNQLAQRLRKLPMMGRWLARALYFIQPLIFVLNVVYFAALFRKQGRFDLSLCNNGGYPAAWGTLAALVASKAAKIKARVLLVHHAATLPGVFMGWFERLVDRQVERVATAIVCVSNATRLALLEKRYFNEENVCVRVIGNSATHSPSTGEAINLRRMLGQFSGLLVGILGRVERYKGQEDLIFAVARLPASIRHQIKVLIIGSGDEREVSHLKGLAAALGVSEFVYFTGYIAGDSRLIVGQLDLLVMATRSFEGFGLTLAEAIQERVPVVATRVGAIPEFVRPENGATIAPCSPGELASAIANFVADSAGWKDRARSAPSDYKLLGETMAREYCFLFRELVFATQ